MLPKIPKVPLANLVCRTLSLIFSLKTRQLLRSRSCMWPRSPPTPPTARNGPVTGRNGSSWDIERRNPSKPQLSPSPKSKPSGFHSSKSGFLGGVSGFLDPQSCWVFLEYSEKLEKSWTKVSVKPFFRRNRRYDLLSFRDLRC